MWLDWDREFTLRAILEKWWVVRAVWRALFERRVLSINAGPRNGSTAVRGGL
jgi:hypothetical protein